MSSRRGTRAGRWVLALLCGLLLSGAGVPAAAQTDPRVLAIIDEVDRLWRGESSQARVSMAIETENWSRTLELDAWSLGTEYSLIRVLSPAREAGTATLKVDDEVWNYLPRVDRTIKVPPSMMVGSWMGSHFTNDDLVRESRLIEDYDIILSFEGLREQGATGGSGDGHVVWEFTMTPKPEAPVIWGKIVQEVRQADRMPTWARYYDEDGDLVRQMSFSGYREMGGRLVPRMMTVEPSDSDERTVVTYHELAFDLGLSEDFFSLRNLRARN